MNEMIEIARNCDQYEIDLLDQVFDEFYPHEITWRELPWENREAMHKIGRKLVQHGRLSPLQHRQIMR